ncbi:hypothetical protein WA026_000186 [Henosepilachna vigintioctopunctata]|uniref:Charged multivesicular body protein 6 n=1 Tax=Henosepilachna vigintioctopunctata TaxID=420089 RepID=A0AAW1V6F5_9CUCU
MGILFGKKKPPSRVTQQDKVVLQLKQQRDKLKQYQRRIEIALNLDREIAKNLLAKGQKERAKLLLKKKRFQEQLLLKTDGQLQNLEQLTHDIEFATVELQVVEGLKLGSEALKKVNDALNIANIEQIMEDTREGIEKQQEISAMISGSLTEEDEEAVDAELAAIISEQMPDVPEEQNEELILPEVPSTPIEGKTKAKKEKKLEEPIALEA